MKILARTLLVAVALTCFTSCYTKEDLEVREQTISELRERHRKMQRGTIDEDKKYSIQLNAARDAAFEAEAGEDSVRAMVESKNLEAVSLREQFATYRKSYREYLFASLPQKTFPSLVIAHMGEVKNVRITAVKDGFMHFQSMNGRSRFPISEIPAKVRDYLKLSEEQADLDQFPEIVTASVMPLDPPADQAGEAPPPSAKDRYVFDRFQSGIQKNERKMNALRIRLSELQAASGITALKIARLQQNRRMHKKLVKERASYKSKNALREIEKLEPKLLRRAAEIKMKIVTLNSLIQKARISP